MNQSEVILLFAHGDAENAKPFAESFETAGFKVVQFHDPQAVQSWTNTSVPVVILLSAAQADLLAALPTLVPALQNRLTLLVYLDDVAANPAVERMKGIRSVNAYRIGSPNAISECISALTDYIYTDTLGSSRGFPTAAAPSPSAEKEYIAKKDATSRSSPGAAPAKNKKKEEDQRTDTQVVGAVYHPKEIKRFAKEPMLVYIAPDSAEALQQVEADAQNALGSRIPDYKPVAARSQTALKYDTELIIIPELEGFHFEPPSQVVVWKGEMIRAAFTMQAVSAPADMAVNGKVKITVGPITFIEARISIFVQSEREVTTLYNTTIQIAHNFRKIFASYSHKDTEIVLGCKKAAEAMNNEYLIDITKLHSGDYWDDKLLGFIDDADVFQLFWSKNSAKSANVQKEWKHAIIKQENLENIPGNGFAGFVQPRYWSKVLYEPIPEKLRKFHFEKIDFSQLGIAKRRGFLRRLFYKQQ